MRFKWIRTRVGYVFAVKNRKTIVTIFLLIVLAGTIFLGIWKINSLQNKLEIANAPKPAPATMPAPATQPTEAKPVPEPMVVKLEPEKPHNTFSLLVMERGAVSVSNPQQATAQPAVEVQVVQAPPPTTQPCLQVVQLPAQVIQLVPATQPAIEVVVQVPPAPAPVVNLPSAPVVLFGYEKDAGKNSSSTNVTTGAGSVVINGNSNTVNLTNEGDRSNRSQQNSTNSYIPREYSAPKPSPVPTRPAAEKPASSQVPKKAPPVQQVQQQPQKVVQQLAYYPQAIPPTIAYGYYPPTVVAYRPMITSSLYFGYYRR